MSLSQSLPSKGNVKGSTCYSNPCGAARRTTLNRLSIHDGSGMRVIFPLLLFLPCDQVTIMCHWLHLYLLNIQQGSGFILYRSYLPASVRPGSRLSVMEVCFIFEHYTYCIYHILTAYSQVYNFQNILLLSKTGYSFFFLLVYFAAFFEASWVINYFNSYRHGSGQFWPFRHLGSTLCPTFNWFRD